MVKRPLPSGSGALLVAKGAEIPVTRGGYLELPGLWRAATSSP